MTRMLMYFAYGSVTPTGHRLRLMRQGEEINVLLKLYNIKQANFVSTYMVFPRTLMDVLSPSFDADANNIF